jgi:hypothetical protein
VPAYLKQQRGYGEAEGLLKRKHPEKFRGFRLDLNWLGRIYTRAGLGFNVGQPIVHHGVFGAGMFQTVYAAPQVWWPLVLLSLEWWAMVCLMLGIAPVLDPLVPLVRSGVLGSWALSPLANPFLVLPVLMLVATVSIAWLVAGQASPPVHQRRLWSRLLIAAMHVAQPVERGWARYKMRFLTIEIPEALHDLRRAWERRAKELLRGREIQLWSEEAVDRETLLKELLALASRHRWFVRIDSGWETHDVRFYGDRWCKADLVTVSENHGGGRRLTRARLAVAPTLYQKAAIFLGAYALLLAFRVSADLALVLLPLVGVFFWHLRASARRLQSAVLAAVLSVAEAHSMSVVGDPDVFRRPAREEPRELVPARAARTFGAWAASLLTQTLLRGRRPAVR